MNRESDIEQSAASTEGEILQPAAEAKAGTPSDPEQYVRALYDALLHREPEADELQHWTGVVRQGMTDRDIFYRFLRSEEYESKERVIPGHPVGHYYSPVIDPTQLPNRPRSRDVSPEDIHGIELSLERMKRWWTRNLAALQATDFPEIEHPSRRYYAPNGLYPYGDALLLRAMIMAEQPRRIIEIGSGFSSACMLDAIDEAKLETELTCIEPNTETLLSRLREEDLERVRIIEAKVQDISVDEFVALRAGDILFIDSSHVLKTGSDVNYELFEILPRLANGVLIHFHDVEYPFEYPEDWIVERRYSWNEAYAVRAFLMYNAEFQVEFMASMFMALALDVIEATVPSFALHPSGSLWVRRRPATRARWTWRRG
jgi:predicted O-methyltransferase YrrM